jgi:ABC-2 type transport system ATP-binding protein
MPQSILETRSLVKKYGALPAVDDLSFSIEEGEIFGLLGPNGAGKSTTISMLTGLFPPDSGEIRILGFDAVADAEKVKQIIGIVPQDLALYPSLTGRENLRFFGEMYGLGGKRLKERVDSVLELVSMTERAGDLVRTYSGGMKRRLNLAVGLVNNPRILFLDEPTVGVDPQSRNHIFESVERLNREQGMTILYTTHYMEEAERLCRRVAIVDRGKIIAQDTPRGLIALLGGGIIRMELSQASTELLQAMRQLSAVRDARLAAEAVTSLPAEAPQAAAPAATESISANGARPAVKIEAHQASEALIQAIQLCSQHGVEILSIETLEPNLETVFLHLTGKSLRQ